LNFRNINWGKSNYCSGTSGRFGLPVSLVLPYNENHITFQFIGISLNIPSKVKYRWQLKGADKEISPSQNKTEITYSNLAPGKYVLVVWSCNDNGDWNKTPQSFIFTITPPFWQTIWFYSLVFVFLLFSVYLVFKWRVRSLQQARDNLKKQVDERTVELRKEKELVEIQNTEIGDQKEQLEQQRDELNEKNISITDSIHYAKRIQSAIMQPLSSAHKSLKDKMFILYEPKDIVSGDFFWFAEIDDHSIVAVADCTGHGVPGAFMSMIGITFLNKLVREKGMIEPNEILNELRKSIIEALHNEHEESKDGMDIALCSVNWKNNRLSYSGANNSLYLIRNGELLETKADKMPIGAHDLSSKPFTKHVVSFIPGDTIYLFTDGYADQFGGSKGKKFLTKKFKSLLLSLQNKPIMEQEEILKNSLVDWMGGVEQVDDILVIGIRLD
jgi:serine phosphatase RsbU (regulator of sigma subunit)